MKYKLVHIGLQTPLISNASLLTALKGLIIFLFLYSTGLNTEVSEGHQWFRQGSHWKQR